MFEKRTWYKEVIIIIVIISLIFVFSIILAPFPYSTLIYHASIFVVGVWRIRKKAITIKEYITLTLIFVGLVISSAFMLPWPYSHLVPFPLLFLLIWIIHKRSSK